MPATRAGADLGALRGAVELVATDAMEDDPSAFGIDQLAIPPVIVNPQTENQNNGRDRIDQGTYTEIYREHSGQKKGPNVELKHLSMLEIHV